MNKPFEIKTGLGPIVAVALHHGHQARPEVQELFALSDDERLREEDPFTGQWTNIVDNSIIVHTSRFQADLNRPREKAVYILPEDAWGLKVWKEEPDQAVIENSLEEYDLFYSKVNKLFSELKRKHGAFVVFDIHSYNHRREGPDGPLADAQENPEVNIGTRTMKERSRFAPIIDRFMAELFDFDYNGRSLDVRENVKFFGGNFAKWAHTEFPDSACVLSIEFKKFFMDEWSGEGDQKQINALHDALASTIEGVLEELKRL